MLPSIQQMLSQSWEAYKKNFRPLIRYMILSSLLIVGMVLLAFGILFALRFSGFVSPLPFVRVLPYVFGMIILSYLIYLSIKISVGFSMRMMQALKNEVVPSFRETLRQAKPFVWKFLGINILVGLISGLPIFIGFIGMLINATDWENYWETYGNTFDMADLSNPKVLFFGAIAVYGFFHALYFSTLYLPSVYGVIFDKKKVFESLTWGKSLVQGRWWSVFWRILAPALVYIVLELLFFAISSLLFITLGESIAQIFDFFATIFVIFAVMIPLIYLPEMILYENVKKQY